MEKNSFEEGEVEIIHSTNEGYDGSFYTSAII